MTLITCRSGSASGDHAALWAAIAYAKFQHRAINNIPRALGSVGEMVWTAERMYAQARSLIPNEEGNLELGQYSLLHMLEFAFPSYRPNFQRPVSIWTLGM